MTSGGDGSAVDATSAPPHSSLVDRLLEGALAIRRLGRKSVCYGALGCFHVSGRFSHFRYVPDPPSLLATRFLLCTRREPTCDDGSALRPLLEASSPAPDAIASLNPELPFKVIVHGFSGRWDSPKVLRAKDAFLKAEECNVVLVDWGTAARGPSYLRAAANTELVGRQGARVLAGLVGLGALPKALHVVGFSLGAQMAGFVGEGLKAQGLKLGRITGLDPASFLFERTNLDTRRKLDSGDAELVDVIHTDGSLLWADGFGAYAPLGHVDFFPNGGQSQPGCSDTYVDALAFRFDQRSTNGTAIRACSHSRSLDLFLESLLSPECRLVGFPCPGLKDFERSFVHGDCFSCDSGSCAVLGRPGEVEGAGGWSGGPGRGPLFLVTRATKPYCGQQVRVHVSLSPRTLSVRGDLQLMLLHGNASTAFNLNTKVYPLRHTVETLHGGRGASSVVALKSGSLSALKTPRLRARILFKPSSGLKKSPPDRLFVERVHVTSQEGLSWQYCGPEAVIETSKGHGEALLPLELRDNC
ncbi:inactive pancreatic lipase-related protein 1-like [Ischnura elegans]|uniref:inactive pancreatic lipase-related protein 1-like n=1 Tax=Ischnura elegans TaxID=197161 RepID=UPI001ED8722B|nr:inactive pancreatic lipase-related protein 1-like [Ischnura elegans]